METMTLKEFMDINYKLGEIMTSVCNHCCIVPINNQHAAMLSEIHDRMNEIRGILLNSFELKP